MHRIQPARLKPGVTLDTIAPPTSADRMQQSSAIVRGKALIFWDLKIPGKKKKLDAIDTDQITPSADCVSESLETLDERWKAGAFRYLMPGFRARVHRGETFVIAGDRFAIGSSREMSPAGLKGVADEAGLEMVIVCGAAMGDIFRRNALNLGLTVVQSRQAVEDAQEGDAFSFDPATRGRPPSAASSRSATASGSPTTRRRATGSSTSTSPSRSSSFPERSYRAPIHTAARTAPTARSATALDPPRLASAGRQATCT